MASPTDVTSTRASTTPQDTEDTASTVQATEMDQTVRDVGTTIIKQTPPTVLLATVMKQVNQIRLDILSKYTHILEVICHKNDLH